MKTTIAAAMLALLAALPSQSPAADAFCNPLNLDYGFNPLRRNRIPISSSDRGQLSGVQHFVSG
jgi:hypothetical protein